MSKHTPGPWEIEERGSHTGEIATIHGAETALGEPTWLEVWSPKWPHNAAANARLIKAAPDMLGALEAALENIGYATDGEQDEKVARAIAAAIAKATRDPDRR